MDKKDQVIKSLLKAARAAVNHLVACEAGTIHHPFRSASLPLLVEAIRDAEAFDPNFRQVKAVPRLNNLGSLITYKPDGDVKEVCLGYLMDFKDKGIFDAYFGRVDVTKEYADIHNRLLSEGQLDGLDKNCQVGMSGDFYVNREKREVRTFVGDLVASAEISGLTITFRRKGKVFRGRLALNEDCFRFRRIS